MPDFNTLRTQLIAARKIQSENKTHLFRAEEKLKKAKRAQDQLKRRTDQIFSIEEEVNGLQDRKTQFDLSLQDLNIRANAFEAFTDPRVHIEQLNDNFPILLFPLRIETRFKIVSSPNGEQHQLWVRVFPDDCSIEHFDNTLSETEIRNAKSYWQELWKAGKPQDENDATLKQFIQDQKKAAWRSLTGVIQAGRAYWITQNYLPLNIDDGIVSRLSDKDIILVIVSDDPPSPAHQLALKAYWKSFYLALGNKLALEAAFTQLVLSLGDENLALKFIEKYSPINIQVPKESENPILAENIHIAFLFFPAPATIDSKESSWSQASRVSTLPDRFVLLGYQGGTSNPSIQALGNIIPDPLIVGPDPSMDIDAVLKEEYGAAFDNLKEEEKVEKYIEYLSKRSETKWLFDFEEAIQLGMGFKINLSPTQYQKGFDKILVLGVKLSADEMEGKNCTEQLLEHHHYGNEGLSFIPQGTATNNTEKAGSGYSDKEDADKTYQQYFPEEDTAPADSSSPLEKKDGRWFAEILGIDTSFVNKIENYYTSDQAEAKAMNRALWPATLAYFLESMMQPLFSEDTINKTKWFFNNYVSGRGMLPALRIGDQAYGILPTTAFSKISWFDREQDGNNNNIANFLPYFNRLYPFLSKLRKDWTALVPQVSHVGKQGDAHQILLDILGLHAGSVEFHQRYAKSYFHIYNWLLLRGYGGGFNALNFSPIFSGEILGGTFKLEGTILLPNIDDPKQSFDGWNLEILNKFFHASANELKGPLIDDRPLSESDAIRAYTDDDKNYLQWLVNAAETSHQMLRNQSGFTENKRPTALLFIMLKHALDLGFLDASLDLHVRADLLSPEQVKFAKIDANTIGIKTQEVPTVESKFDYLYKREANITPQNIQIGDYIATSLRQQIPLISISPVKEQLAAIRQLIHTPTANLERAFVEHLDCCSYRLDAWLMGLVNFQLSKLRYEDNQEEVQQQGLYLGAFAWLEDVRAENKKLEAVELAPDLDQIFNQGAEEDLVKDKTNAGYVHTPSLNHAVTAAVLRNAYLSNASPSQPDLMNVNLSSERVRMALAIVEGMQQGQSLAALLGYQLERGLHDRHQIAEVDKFIYELRKVFPLRAKHLKSTAVADNELDSIVQIEARNVVDGLALVEHIKSTGIEAYPFGKTLAAATPAQQAVINTEVERIINIEDAVADLAIAESVHQVVQYNYDRAAGTLDAFSKGAYPQTPDIIKTPRSGVNLLHRVALQLEAAIDPALGTTAKAQAAPAINQWLVGIFPPLGNICCKVYFINAPPGYCVSMADLNLNAIDVLYLLDLDGNKNLAALDDFILQHVHSTQMLSPDISIALKYTSPIANKFSFFEVAALAESLRTILLSSRALKASDIKLQNEAQTADDLNVSINKDRIELPLAQLKLIRTNLDNHKVAMENFVKEDFEETVLHSTDIINIDNFIASYADLLRQAGTIGIEQTGFGFAYEQRGIIYNAIMAKITDYKDRWEAQQTKYDDLINAASNATTEEEKFQLLQQAERSISTSNTIPIPNTILAYQNILTNKRTIFDNKLTTINAILNNKPQQLSALFTAVDQLKNNLPLMSDFDLVAIEIEAQARQVLILAEDIYRQVQKLLALITKQITAVEALLVKNQDSILPQEKVDSLIEAAKILFGESFKMIPEFEFSKPQAAELQKCWDDRDNLLSYQKNNLETDFPTDDWLYGIARVREKINAFENTMILSESLNNSSLDLTALQLPYLANDHWLALSYPEEYQIESDKLLYTAHHAIPFNPNQKQCGLFLDEWTEVIPTEKETTGLTFHYDQPNSEPPQTILLAVSPESTGTWKWNNLVDTLHETLEMAKLRAVEPTHIDKTSYTRFLPATVAAVTVYPVSIMMDYAINNGIIFQTINANEDES